MRKEKNDNDFSVYPNPATEHITIMSRKNITENTEIVLSDITGKILLKKSYSNTQPGIVDVLPLTTLEKGIYFLSFRNNNGFLVTEKIIKE